MPLFLALYAWGVSVVNDLNTLMKCDWSENPLAYAVCVSDRPE